jgi:hypothetical protein
MKKLLLFIGILVSSISVFAQVVNENPYPLIECEDVTDGFAYFNLHQADSDISMGNTSLIITYHLNNLDAEMAINALISPHMNMIAYNDLVYARVVNNQGVHIIVELELVVASHLTIHPNDLTQLDDDEDGFAIFDLTENDAIVLAELNPMIFSVSYYETEENAENDEFAIVDPTAYQSMQNPQTIYVRIDNVDGSCMAITSFTISVGALSVDSFGFENLKIYPNPSSGSFTIQSTQLISEATISLYDIQGKLVFYKNLLPQNRKVELDISFLKKGAFFVKISSEENISFRKLIKI